MHITLLRDALGAALLGHRHQLLSIGTDGQSLGLGGLDLAMPKEFGHQDAEKRLSLI
jgi:hypothetical protein